MKVYENVVIGCGYASIGYAIANKSTLILEKRQSADTSFYLPLKTFKKVDFTPKTECARQLNELFESKNLYKDGIQNTNAFESVFCEFILSKNINVLFKSTVISISKNKNLFEITYSSVNGLSKVFAKNVLDMRKGTADEKFLTVLFYSPRTLTDTTAFENQFNDCYIEKAFFQNGYALHFKVDINKSHIDAKEEFLDKWKTLQTDCKILYLAPKFYYTYSQTTLPPKDAYFDSPIKALEQGYLYTLTKGE